MAPKGEEAACPNAGVCWPKGEGEVVPKGLELAPKPAGNSVKRGIGSPGCVRPTPAPFQNARRQQAARLTPSEPWLAVTSAQRSTGGQRLQEHAWLPKLGSARQAAIGGGCQTKLHIQRKPQQPPAGQGAAAACRPSPRTPAALRAVPAAQRPPRAHLRQSPQSSLRSTASLSKSLLFRPARAVCRSPRGFDETIGIQARSWVPQGHPLLPPGAAWRHGVVRELLATCCHLASLF